MADDDVSFLGRLRRHRWTLLAGAATLAVAALAGPRLLWGPQVAVHAVQQREFVQTVVASGRVQAPHRVELGAQVTGTVRRVAVVEGQAVAAGEVLVELEDAEARAALAQAELAERQAALRLRQLDELQQPLAEQALRQAQANLEAAARQRERQRELFAQGFIGQAALDEAQRAWEVADAALRSARQQLRSTADAAGSDRVLAQAALAAARAAVEAAQARLAYTRIAAPVAGQVVTRNVEPGAVVQAGKALLVLAPEGPTELVLQVDEKNLALLQPGQRALAAADAYPSQRFEARVARILPGVDAQRGAVEVRLAVPRPPAVLRQDMTVSVDVEVARRERALVLPAELLHDDGAQAWVAVLRQGRVQRQALRTGLRGTAQLEVLQGLQAGDLVVAGVAPEVGTRARALLQPEAVPPAGPQP